MKHVGNENSFSVFRSVIITTQEVTTDENAFSQTYNEFVTVNVVIKTFKPSVCPTSKRSFWEDVLQTFCRLCHDDLAKLVLKYVILNQTAIDNLYEIPILFDLTVRDEAEIVGILKELKLVCSTKLLKYSRNSALLDTKKLETIFWDPTDLTKSINNLPNPGKWCQRTSTSVIHVVGACASWINAPEGYEIHRPERVPREEGHKGTTTDVSADGGGGGFKVIYYSDSFFESNFFPSHGDIILLYPGNYYCGWQVRSIFVVPSVELYGVNNGIHELDVVGTSRYSELCSTDGGLLDVGSSFYQPFPIYNIFANLTVRSRQDGRPISVRGAEVHLLLFNCCLKTAHFPAILFSPSSVGTLLMRRCFVSGAMDSCLVLGKASDISAVQHIDISLKDCKITKSGRGYLTKRGHSPAISILTVSSLEIEGCVVRDNVGHAFQMRAPKHRRPNKLTLKGNVLKRNQACDSLSLALTRTTKSTHGNDDSGSKYDMKKQANECCKYRPASPNATATSFSSTSVAGGSSGVPGHHQQPESKEDGSLVVRGRYCFQCGQPAQKICGHCRNAFYCNVQCQLQHWGSQSDETGGCVGGHRRYCVK